jgi:CRP-like cAMP-binding protein
VTTRARLTPPPPTSPPPSPRMQYIVDYFVKNFPDQVKVGGGIPSDVAAAAEAMGITAPADGDVETDSEDDDDDWVDDLPTYTPVETVKGGGGRRRTAVSAASTNSTDLIAQYEAQKKTHDKTPAEIERLTELLKQNMLFGHLDAKQTGQLIDAFFPKELPNGEEIIVEGADGDLFYILDTGTCEVFKNQADGERKKVHEYEPGASFGELALMYNAPRAATIVASSACKVFALDRLTFKVVLMESTKEKRGLYESFLSGVDLLHSLDSYERSTIADALHEVSFSAGDTIITQGRTFSSSFVFVCVVWCGVRVVSSLLPVSHVFILLCIDLISHTFSLFAPFPICRGRQRLLHH